MSYILVVSKTRGDVFDALFFGALPPESLLFNVLPADELSEPGLIIEDVVWEIATSQLIYEAVPTGRAAIRGRKHRAPVVCHALP
jgi:hypothetical protein